MTPDIFVDASIIEEIASQVKTRFMITVFRELRILSIKTSTTTSFTSTSRRVRKKHLETLFDASVLMMS